MKHLKTIKAFTFLLVLIIGMSCQNQDIEEETYTKQDELNDLNSYLSALIQKGDDIDTTESGVYYVVLEEGEGDYPLPGDSLIIKYKGFFIDNSIFDSSENNNEDGTFSFNFVEDPMIPGFEDVLSLIKGQKSTWSFLRHLHTERMVVVLCLLSLLYYLKLKW